MHLSGEAKLFSKWSRSESKCPQFTRGVLLIGAKSLGCEPESPRSNPGQVEASRKRCGGPPPVMETYRVS